MPRDSLDRSESLNSCSPSRSRRREDGRNGRTADLDRRRFLAACSAAGVGGTLLPGVLWARIQQAEGVPEKAPRITVEMIEDAETVAGLELSDEERRQLLEGVDDSLDAYEALRALEIPNDVPPAVSFDPVMPGISTAVEAEQRPLRISPQGAVDVPEGVGGAAGAGGTREAGDAAASPSPAAPEALERLCYLPVTQLAELLRRRRVTSEALTRMYLGRLKRLDATLHCVVTLTEELALRQARRADQEIAAGLYRGPLHGIPWVAKDLLATRDYPTTWGAMPYRDQWIHEDATVVERLDDAGAVLIAKATLGALAWGDVWFGGMTRNPWNLEQGSSGSSAGSSSAVAAGCAGFGIGTETLGSIVSPSTRCGCSGLRPTFGRVSRYGAMALSWTMDKIGPICRSAEDCALVFSAIHGDDGLDPTARGVPFNWDPYRPATRLRVGYFRSAFERDDPDYRNREFDRATLAVLRDIGFELVEFDMPEFPAGALRIVLSAESAAAFDELTRSGRDDLMVRQVDNAWPNAFREARFIPAVEYIQANRARTMLMRMMDEAMRDVDVFVTPSYGGSVLMVTNLTGHPCAVVPNGFMEPEPQEPERGKEGVQAEAEPPYPNPGQPPLQPVSISFIGRLYGDSEALAVAHAYQQATDFHRRHPDLSAARPTPAHPPDAPYLGQNGGG